MGVFDDILLKKIPQFNVFKCNPTVKSSFAIGDLIPVYHRNLVPGERERVKLSQLTRFAPLPAPVMDNFELSFIAFEVPKRVIDHNFGTNMYKFFNPATPDDSRGSLPFMTLEQIYSQLGDVTGSLADWFGYPSLNSFISQMYKDITPTVYPDLFAISYPAPLIDFQIQFQWQGKNYTFQTQQSRVFGSWIYQSFGLDVTEGYDTIDDVSTVLGIPSYNLIRDFVRTKIADLVTFIAEHPSSGSFNSVVNTIPFCAYWQVIADWFINSNLDGDTEEFIQNSGIIDTWQGESPRNKYFTRKGLTPFKRYWANDRFTSAFPNALYSNSQVAIPVNGTIKDLRQSFIIDGFKQSVLYSGKRYIDNILSLFGVKSSNALLDRSSVIGMYNTQLSIDALSQANQSDINSSLETPIGTLIGQGTAVTSSEFLYDFTAEEHTSIIILECVRPKASYYQGIDRENLKLDYYDFLIPNFDKIGEQPVYNVELYFDKNGDTYNDAQPSIFGFNRRYYEYMDCPSSVHGEFRTSLDYWHAARQFDSQPTLSHEFCQVDADGDNINRIFATTLADPIRQILRLEIERLSPIQKVVTYDL